MKIILQAVVLMFAARVLDFDLSYVIRRMDGDDRVHSSASETPLRRSN
jgi:hypothetical protein